MQYSPVLIELTRMIDAVIQGRLPLWKQVFETDENSILKSLNTMAWDLAAFSCFVEIVNQAPNGGQGEGKLVNLMLVDLLATGFWTKTLISVRRLAEKNGTINGARGVCSLRGLIEDIRQQQARLKRGVFIYQIAGLPYNYDLLEKDKFQYYQSNSKTTGEKAIFMPRRLNVEQVRQRHAMFDALSGTTPGTSTPDDLISPHVFQSMAQKLDSLTPVLEHIDVAIAHAATKQSRQGRELDQWPLSEAKAALKTLTEVAQIVGELFCFSGVGNILPIPHFDQFAHLNQPWFTGSRATLEKIWASFHTESSQWSKIPFQTILP